jgi:hypothetical protein
VIGSLLDAYVAFRSRYPLRESGLPERDEALLCGLLTEKSPDDSRGFPALRRRLLRLRVLGDRMHAGTVSLPAVLLIPHDPNEPLVVPALNIGSYSGPSEKPRKPTKKGKTKKVKERRKPTGFAAIYRGQR